MDFAVRTVGLSGNSLALAKRVRQLAGSCNQTAQQESDTPEDCSRCADGLRQVVSGGYLHHFIQNCLQTTQCKWVVPCNGQIMLGRVSVAR